MASMHAEEARDVPRKLDELTREISKALVGYDQLIEQCIVALLCEGHVLLEGAPGLGKTRLVNTIGQAIELKTSRVQCTPDLMPADIVGTHMLVADESGIGRREVRFAPGPVFTHLLLADEINRATPKTQSALLEAMQERSVTIGGETRRLERPFFVMATQNPIEMEGTYPLPEAQIDRFFFKLIVTNPTSLDLIRIVEQTTGREEPQIRPVVDRSELLSMQSLVRDIPAASHVVQFAVDLVDATHPSSPAAPDIIRQYVAYGASPRGAQTLILAAKARALMHGRLNASIQDVQHMAPAALRHRLIFNFEAQAADMSPDDAVEALLAQTRVQGAG